MENEVAKNILFILDRYAIDNGNTILAENGKAAENLAHAIYAFVLDLFRKDARRSLFAERYRQFPEAYSAPLSMELAEMMKQNSQLKTKLKGFVTKYETAVSPSTTQTTVTGSGTIVQGDHNVVVGAGATYIENSQINAPKAEAVPETDAGASSEMAQLRKQIAFYFDLSDLQNLCWDLGIRYEDLGGDGLSAKVRELLAYCVRNGRLSDLLDYCRQERGHVEWPLL